MNKKTRWYDKHKKLAPLLESFKDMPKKRKDNLVAGVMEIIKNFAPQLLDKYVLDFPLDFYRRRWYDKDPHLWLLFNGLQFADKALLMKVTQYLAKSIKLTHRERRL